MRRRVRAPNRLAAMVRKGKAMWNYRNKNEWLSILGLAPEHIPSVLVLWDAAQLDRELVDTFSAHTRLIPLQAPWHNGPEILVGLRDGMVTAHAAAINLIPATELVHLFGTLGTGRLLYNGHCRGISRHINRGDFFAAVEAYSGEGVSACYQPADPLIAATYEGPEVTALLGHQETALHWGRVYSTAVPWILAQDQFTECFRQQCWAVDTTTASVYAVARHFGMKRLALLRVVENPVYDEPAKPCDHADRKCQYQRQQLRLAGELARAHIAPAAPFKEIMG